MACGHVGLVRVMIRTAAGREASNGEKRNNEAAYDSIHQAPPNSCPAGTGKDAPKAPRIAGVAKTI
jgi:hypothetical protein